MISERQRKVLGLGDLGNTNSMVYETGRKDLRITFVLIEGSRYKIIGRFKYVAFLPPVRQISYIDEQSLINFAELAIDEDELVTSFRTLVIDSIIGHLKDKGNKLIKSN